MSDRLPVPSQGNPVVDGTIDAPTPAEPSDPIRDHVQAALLEVLQDPEFDLRAYLTKMARTEPKTFQKWVGAYLNRAPAPPSGKPGGQQTIVQVLSALPRTALDGLPPGMTLGIPAEYQTTSITHTS